MNERTPQAAVDKQRWVQRTHAVASDFCSIFERDMGALYSLALLLTGERKAAERCYLDALEDCLAASDVFPEWAQSWSRRAVIKRAIRQVKPRPGNAGTREAETVNGATDFEDVPRLLLQLPPFERFVFGAAVLERYSIRECATLLGCHASDVERARIAALQTLGASREDGRLSAWLMERTQPHAAVA